MGDICTSSFSNHHTRGVGPIPGYHKCALSTAYSISSFNRKLNRTKIVKAKRVGFFSSLTFPQPRIGYSGQSTCYHIESLVNPGIEPIVSFILCITFYFLYCDKYFSFKNLRMRKRNTQETGKQKHGNQ